MKIIQVLTILMVLNCLTSTNVRADKRSLADTETLFGPSARVRMLPSFIVAGVDYPPKSVTLLAIKDERRVELWATNDQSEVKQWIHVRDYKVLAASGIAGPKLKRGDKQVPEGMYSLEYLNPNSRFHLSFKINYPNAWDRLKGLQDNRPDLGDNIFLHGSFFSIGCLAMGDSGIEELFTLVRQVGKRNVKVIIAPYDLRDPTRPIKVIPTQPRWVPALYQHIQRALMPFTLQ